MSSKDKLIGFTLIIVGIAFIALGVMSGMPKGTNNPGIYNEQTPSSEELEDIDLNVWNGKYTGEFGEITLYRTSDKKLEMLLVVTGEGEGMSAQTLSYTFDLNSDNKLVNTSDAFGETKSITIERNDAGIAVQASSTEKTSMLNKITGSYTKETYTSMQWNGVYTSGDVAITLAEVEGDRVRITINKDFSTYGQEVKNITEDTLIYEDESFGDTEKITIKKSTDGITVEASTTKENGILNGINATYKKVN